MAETYKSIAGRNCTPAPIAISLHKFVGSLSQLDGYISNCLNKNRPSYNYGIDGCKTQEFVPVADTAYAIPYPVCPVPLPPDCPPILAECSDGTTVIDGFTGNPNCKVISVAVVSGLNNADFCGDDFNCEDSDTQCLARLLNDIAVANGITLTAQSLLLYGFDEFPICELLECIANLQPIEVPPNPEVVLLCNALSQFPTGTIVTVIGKDATGACVQGALPAEVPLVANDTPTVNLTASGAFGHTLIADVIISAQANNLLSAQADGLFVTAPTVVLNVNTAVPQLEVTVNGGTPATLPLVELREAITNVLLGYIFQP